jgi:hypothetical protein
MVFTKCHTLLPRAKLRTNNLAFSGWMNARILNLVINEKTNLKEFLTSSRPFIESIDI